MPCVDNLRKEVRAAGIREGGSNEKRTKRIMPETCFVAAMKCLNLKRQSAAEDMAQYGLAELRGKGERFQKKEGK